MKTLIVLVVLLGLPLSSRAYTLKNLGIAINKKGNTVVCFVQVSRNAMSKETIKTNGILIIKKNEKMIFKYPEERVVINNFEVTFYNNREKKVYKIKGFNRILYELFIGAKNVDALFNVTREQNNVFVLKPKYQSNINDVILYIKNGKLKHLKIIDIYYNTILYTFDYDSHCIAAQK